MKKISLRKIIFSILIFSISLINFWFLSSCASNKQAGPKTAEEYFKEGMELFNKEDYLEAEHTFDLIKLQYPASQYADDAQFYLAESNYKRKEFYMAAYNYATLRRIYPRSEFVKKALFNAALCYNELSPPFDRDQDYTLKAIKAFSEFQNAYPGDSLYTEATNFITELRNKLAHRDYFTAGLYRKLYSLSSAVIYYDNVINDYPDTKFYEPAFAGKIEVLIELKKIDEAKSVIENYKKLFPNGANIDKIKSFDFSNSK
ncbi:MAG: outer membrane protein assembly factor BamD [FCB group bacterium]